MTLDMGAGESAQMLQRSARDYFTRSYNLERARAAERTEAGYDQELWNGIRELGWLTLGLDGGSPQSSLLDACALLEEFGMARAVTPFKESVVAVGSLAATSTSPLSSALVEQIGEGKVFSCALASQCGGLLGSAIKEPLHAQVGDATVSLNGQMLFVPFVGASVSFLAAARAPGNGDTLLVLVPSNAAGLSHRRVRAISPVPQYEVTLVNVSVPATQIVGSEANAKRILQSLLVTTCAEMLGGCARVLEQTSNYAKDRVQFGQPIGSFQAIQNRFASVLIDLDVTRYMIYDAAWRIAEGVDADEQVAYLGAWAGQALERICIEGHHINGAMSVTEEYGLEFISRQALGTRLTVGDPSDYKENLISQIQRQVMGV